MEQKKNKNKKIIGWKSKYFEINFSMSCQLWFHFDFFEVENYIISEVLIHNNNKKLTYSDIFNLIQ